MTDHRFVYGINSVKARLKRGAGGVSRLLLKQGQLSNRLKEIETLARKLSVPVERVDVEEFDVREKIAHQGVALELVKSSVAKVDLKDVIEGATGPLLFLVLDGVTDPRNLGACVRSAATMGANGVIVPKDNSAGMTEVAVKTASGGASIVPVIEVVNLSRCLDELKKENIWIVGTVLNTEQALREVDLTGHIAIVLGAEDKGLRQNTIKHCDFLATIPMVNSELGFNVSVAAGICLYEASRQRQA